MSRQGSQYSSTSYQPVLSSTGYSRTSRPTASTTNGSATSIIKAINAGAMNVSTTSNVRVRPLSRVSQPSPERPIRNPIQRRQPSQDRSVSFFY